MHSQCNAHVSAFQESGTCLLQLSHQMIGQEKLGPVQFLPAAVALALETVAVASSVVSFCFVGGWLCSNVL